MKNRIVLIVGLVLVLVVLIGYLFTPTCASEEYVSYKDICIIIPRWKLLVFDLFKIK